MKGLFKSMVKTAWESTSAIRGPFVRKLDSHIDQVLTRTFETRLTPILSRIERSISASQESHSFQTTDTNLVLNSLIREIERLHMQMEILQQATQSPR